MAARKFKIGTAILVLWLDSAAADEYWEPIDEPGTLEPVTSETIGFLLEDRKDYLILAMSRSKFQVGSRIAIPKATILKVRVLH